MKKKVFKVGILGATGLVGQRFVQLLDNHPWFVIAVVAASPNSAGKSYATAVRGRWSLDRPVPESLKNLKVYSVKADISKIARQVNFVFSALDMKKQDIKIIEEAYAQYGIPVISNNSAHRWTNDVPMIIPEVNANLIKMIDIQRKNRNWKNGFIVVKPNCSIQSYVAILTALKKFKPIKVLVVSFQSISGAGKTFDTWPEMNDNVIPFIEGEEDKSEKEPLKIWGELQNDHLILAKTPKIAATCLRIPVTNGHMACVSVSFLKKPTKKQIFSAIEKFNDTVSILNLPSSPQKFITVYEENNHPQLKLARNNDHGMGISIGRLQKDKFFDFRFVALSHNTIRGAAGGAILIAELLVKNGYIR